VSLLSSPLPPSPYVSPSRLGHTTAEDHRDPERRRALPPEVNGWLKGAYRYVYTMLVFHIHSTIAWTAIGIAIVAALACVINPLMWPCFILFVWRRYRRYREGMKQSKLFDGGPIKDVDDLKERLLSHLGPQEEGTFRTRDGLNLRYGIFGNGDKTILLCNGVNCSYLLWSPAHTALQRIYTSMGGKGEVWTDDFRVVTWDYRGQFDSDDPCDAVRFSVERLTDDALDLMVHLGIPKFHGMGGWSTGVQIALQFAATYPDKVERLFLVNGNWGHTLTCAFQISWYLPNPLVPRILHSLIWVCRYGICPYPNLYAIFLRIYRVVIHWLRRYLWKPLGVLTGIPTYEWMMLLNASDVFGNTASHANNVGIILQALDCHSVAALLPEVRTPTVMLTGLLDAMTPPYQQYEMAGIIPNIHLVPFLLGTHHSIEEYPNQIARLMVDFFCRDWDDFKRKCPGRVRLAPIMIDR